MKVKLGEKEFEVSPLTLGDWKKIEKKFGTSMQEFAASPTFEQISYILWYAIHKQDETVKQEEIDELVIPGSDEYGKILQAISPGSDQKNL